MMNSSRILKRDLFHVGTVGLRARPIRAALSALGIALGIAAMIAVVSSSYSMQAKLNQQLNALGPTLFQAEPATPMGGQQPRPFSEHALGHVQRIPGVEHAVAIGELPKVQIYKNPLLKEGYHSGVSSVAVSGDLLSTLKGQVAAGTWHNDATAQYPTVVLGNKAANTLGVATPGINLSVDKQTVTVIGVLGPLDLAPDLNFAAFFSEQTAKTFFGYDGKPKTLYQTTTQESHTAVRALLPMSLDPEHPHNVAIQKPSEALAAKQTTDELFSGLILGLGGVALLVGGIGIANTMIISVLERRQEIGLRRSLGARRSHIRSQFLIESLILSMLGGIVGIFLGATLTAVGSLANDWLFTIPLSILAITFCATLTVGAIAGFYPAVRAAKTPPTAALNS